MTQPVTSPPSSRLPKKPTLADIRDRLKADVGLVEPKRGNCLWSLKKVAEACGMPMELIPADPMFLNEKLKDFAPATIDLAPSTWINALALLRFAFRHTGVIKAPARRIERFSPAWTALMKLPKRKTDLIGLSRLARHCSTHGIEPEQVNDQVFDDLLTDLETNQIVKNGRKSHRRATQIWNGLANSTPGWPNQLVKVPCYSKTYAIPWTSFPASLAADVEAHLAELDGSDPLSALDVKTLKPLTIRTRRHQLHILVSAEVLSGEDPNRFRTLADVVDATMVRKGLRYLLKRVGGDSKAQAHDVSRTVVSVARHWVKLPPGQLAPLQAMCKCLDQPAGMTKKNRDRLRQLDDPAAVKKLLQLPEMLMKKVRRHEGPPTKAEALLAQTALMIEILLMIPIRRHNVAALDMHKHIVRNRNGRVYLMIDGAEVKNGVDVDAELFPHVVKMLDLYIKKYRPLLTATESTWLFPGLNGRAKCPERVAQQVSQACKTVAGLHIHMHLMRHIAAKLYLDQHPGAYGVVQRLLGHKLLQTTIGIYSGMEQRSTVAHFDNVILGLRS